MNDLRIIATGGAVDRVHGPLTEAPNFARDGSLHISKATAIGRRHFAQVRRINLDFNDAGRGRISAAAPEEAIIAIRGAGRHGRECALAGGARHWRGGGVHWRDASPIAEFFRRVIQFGQGELCCANSAEDVGG